MPFRAYQGHVASLGALIERVHPMQHHPPKHSEGLIAELKHGIQFGIWNPMGNISISDVEDFLNDALTEFKEQRRRIVKYRYAMLPWGNGLTDRGLFQLSCAKRLAATYWVQAIAEAYSCATTVQQMQGSINDWKDAATRDGGELREVIDMVEKPGGDLFAFFTLVKRTRLKNAVKI
jgi:hypothetical protein